MPEKVTLLNEKGESLQSDIVALFNINQKKFIITTNNEIDPNGLTVLHVSEVVGDKLTPITDDKDWDATKNVMRSVISGNENRDFKYEPVISNINVNGIYSRDISVENSALKAIITDYMNNKPVDSDNSGGEVVQIGNSPAPNPFSSPVYAAAPPNNQGNMGQEVAPGISEVNSQLAGPVNFQQVGDLGNPVDLMVNGQSNNNFNQFNNGQMINQNPGFNQFNNQDPSLNNFNFNQPMGSQDMNMTQEIDNNVVNTEPQIAMSNNIVAGDLMSMLGPDASIDDAVKTSASLAQGVLVNLINYVAQKRNAELDEREAQLNQKQAELLAMEQGIQYKLAGNNNQLNNPMMNNTIPQQPMMPNNNFNQFNNMQQPMGQPVNQPMNPIPQNNMNQMPNNMNNGMYPQNMNNPMMNNNPPMMNPYNNNVA